MSTEQIRDLMDKLDSGEIDAQEYERRLNEILERTADEAKSSGEGSLQKARIRSSSRIARRL
jgi:hypothetical protein